MEELKDVLRETLENRGALGSVRAHLRAEVSNALEDRTGLARPEISDENLIINELIREYLVFNRYRSTLSVLLPESGQPETPPSTVTSSRGRFACARRTTPASSPFCTPCSPTRSGTNSESRRRSTTLVPTRTAANRRA